MKQPSAEQVLIAIALFLAPLLGGQLAVQPIPMSSMIAGVLEGSAPLGAQFLIGLLVLAAAVLVLAKRKVVPVPNLAVTLPLCALLVTITMSHGFSMFKMAGLPVLLMWWLFAAALFTAVASVGRSQGHPIYLGAIVAGCSVLAVRGIMEYSSMRAIDPTWRIFAGWIQPNALAGMLILGFPLAVSLMLQGERLVKLLAGSAAVLIGLALALSQSRGGLLGLVVGIFAMLVALVVWRKSLKEVGLALVPILLSAVLVVGVQQAAKKPTGGEALGRVGSVSSTQEQSVGYRQLLWKGAAQTMQKHPFGLGVGTYRFESARSGLHPVTVLTHQSYLQVGFESGVVALAFLVALALGWLYAVLRGARKLCPERATMLAGVLGAAMASATQNLTESGWYHLGCGLVFFVVLGIGLQLAADGSSPEYMPLAPMRGLGIFVSASLLAGLGFTALQEQAKGQMAESMMQGKPLDAVPSLLAGDGEAIAMVADSHQAQGKTDGLLSQRSMAAQLLPTARNHRAHAAALLSSGQTQEAKFALERVFTRDPNNLPTHLQLVKLRLADGVADGLQALDRMLEIEKSPYYQVQALPEYIETETAEARVLVAEVLPRDNARRVTLLKEALEIYRRYRDITAPIIQRAVKEDPNVNIAGQSAASLAYHMKMASKAARMVAEAQRAGGRTVEADLSEVEAASFEAAGGAGL